MRLIIIPFSFFIAILHVCYGCTLQIVPYSISTIDLNEENGTWCTESQGRNNAVNKARQMTDILFSPVQPIAANNSIYEAGITYRGLIYSSSREMEALIGNDVSIHTFMTAIHNPRSKIYTEDISKPPYHGTNCRAYYGTVCSSFVSYALGIEPRLYANDYPASKLMKEVKTTNPDSLEIADVLWKDGHVALITDFIRDEKGGVEKLEISESVVSGCRRYYISKESFKELMYKDFKKILRYTEFYKNSIYRSIPEFVAIGDENYTPFHYNEDLYVDKGDKACYLETEDVVVNTFHPYDTLEIYKDNILYKRITESLENVILSGLPYGDYKARLITGEDAGDYTYWKIINLVVWANRSIGRLYFYSLNATPMYVRFSDITGSSGLPTTDYLHMLSKEEKLTGYIDIDEGEIDPEYPFVRVAFETQYGKVINEPFNWYE